MRIEQLQSIITIFSRGQTASECFFLRRINQIKFNYREEFTAAAVIGYFQEGLTIKP